MQNPDLKGRNRTESKFFPYTGRRFGIRGHKVLKSINKVLNYNLVALTLLDYKTLTPLARSFSSYVIVRVN